MDKAAALGYSLTRNHGFIDGNKRIAHAAMEVFLIMNGMELRASVDDQERFMLALAAGDVSREALAGWLRAHSVELGAED
jgi:death-on-curing protein